MDYYFPWCKTTVLNIIQSPYLTGATDNGNLQSGIKTLLSMHWWYGHLPYTVILCSTWLDCPTPYTSQPHTLLKVVSVVLVPAKRGHIALIIHYSQTFNSQKRQLSSVMNITVVITYFVTF